MAEQTVGHEPRQACKSELSRERSRASRHSSCDVIWVRNNCPPTPPGARKLAEARQRRTRAKRKKGQEAGTEY